MLEKSVNPGKRCQSPVLLNCSQALPAPQDRAPPTENLFCEWTVLCHMMRYISLPEVALMCPVTYYPPGKAIREVGASLSFESSRVFEAMFGTGTPRITSLAEGWWVLWTHWNARVDVTEAHRITFICFLTEWGVGSLGLLGWVPRPPKVSSFTVATSSRENPTVEQPPPAA